PLQFMVAVVSDETVRAAVIAVISDADTLRPADMRQTRLGRYIGKVALAVVTVKLEPPTLACLALERGSVGEKDVVDSIAVVVENRDPIPRGLENIVFPQQPAIDVSPCKPRAFRDVQVFGPP